MSPTELEQLLDEVTLERRSFLKKMILAMGYAAPIVSVFSMEAMNIGSAMAQISNLCSNFELQVSTTASPDPVIKGENLTYTIKLLPCFPTKTTFPISTGVVTFTDPLPTGTTFVSATQTQGVPFTLTTPAVGDNGIVSGVSSSDLSHTTTVIFEIVVRVLP